MLVHVGSQDQGLGTPSRYLATTIRWNPVNCYCYFKSRSRNIPSGHATDNALLHSCTGTKNSAARVIPGLTCKATASRLRSFLQNLMRSSPGSIAGAAGRAGALSASFRFMEPPSSRALLSRRAGRWIGRACRICKVYSNVSGYVS